MFIHYFIILHGFIVVSSSILNSIPFNTNLHTHTRLFHRKNRTINNRSIYKSNLSSTNIIRLVNNLIKHKNHPRIRRDFLRENTINDEDNLNIYDNDDGRYFRNQQEEIDGEYYLPIKKKFKMRDNNELYEDDLDHINYERNADKRYMQNDKELINRNRLFQINSNEKDLNDYYHILKKQRNRYGNKYLDNDYLDTQDQI